MANAVLARLKGYRYHAFEAGSANLDPAAELGDGITAGGVYGVIGRLNDDGSGYPEIDAPSEAELEDEYPSSGPMTQELNRKIAQTRSSITKTAEQIRLEVSNGMQGLSASIDVKLGSITSRVDGLDGRYSSLTQTVDGITQRVQGLDGKYAEVQLTLDGLTITGPSGQTLIKGSSIETGSIAAGSITADKLNIRGSISFADLEQNVVEEITSGITQAQAKTLITSTLVSSPNIAGGRFMDINQGNWLEMGLFGETTGYLNHYCTLYSNTEPISVMGLVRGGGGWEWTIASFGHQILTVGYRYHSAIPWTVAALGNWDFSSAAVTGLPSTTAVFA